MNIILSVRGNIVRVLDCYGRRGKYLHLKLETQDGSSQYLAYVHTEFMEVIAYGGDSNDLTRVEDSALLDRILDLVAGPK